jgi:DNA segregation ATPase FtsK/SpoIIIE-like protein
MDKIGTVQLIQGPKSAWNLFIQSLKKPFRTWLSSCKHLRVVLRPFEKVDFYPFFLWTMAIRHGVGYDWFDCLEDCCHFRVEILTFTFLFASYVNEKYYFQ